MTSYHCCLLDICTLGLYEHLFVIYWLEVLSRMSQACEGRMIVSVYHSRCGSEGDDPNRENESRIQGTSIRASGCPGYLHSRPSQHSDSPGSFNIMDSSTAATDACHLALIHQQPTNKNIKSKINIEFAIGCTSSLPIGRA